MSLFAFTQISCDVFYSWEEMFLFIRSPAPSVEKCEAGERSDTERKRALEGEWEKIFRPNS